jgi:hypothetical protein
MNDTHSYQSRTLLVAAMLLCFACDGNSEESKTKTAEGTGGTAGTGGASNSGKAGAPSGGTSATHSGKATGGTVGSSSATTADECVSDAKVVCANAIDRSIRCGDYTDAERTTRYDTCVTRSAAVKYNCSFANSFATCLATLACDGDDEQCVYNGLIDAKPEGWDVDTIAACTAGTITDEATCDAAIGGPTRTCLTRYEACAAAAADQVAPFHDDGCFTLGALSSTAIAKGVACLSLDCDAIGDCLAAAGTFGY